MFLYTPAVTFQSQAGPIVYKVTCLYKAELQDELTIKPGDLVRVSREDHNRDKEWIMGTHGAAKGFFHKAFATLLTDESGVEPRKPPSGYKVNFTQTACVVKEKPGNELECIRCTSLASNPQQTNCCGHTLCQTCVEKWRTRSRECPNCRSDKFKTTSDARIRRHIASLTAYCPHHEDSCDWQGSIAKLQDHLSKDCKYELVTCPCCGAKEYAPQPLQNSKEKAKSGSLATGDSSRQYFGSVSQVGRSGYCVIPSTSFQQISKHLTYKVFTEDHSKRCPKWPMRCPNRCNMKENEFLTRSTLQGHLVNNCPEQAISCQYVEAGCTVRVKRKNMADHNKTSTEKHLTMLMAKFKEIKAQHTKLQASNESLEKENARLKECLRQKSVQRVRCSRRDVDD